MNESQSFSELFNHKKWQHMQQSLQHSLWSTKHNKLLASAIFIQNLKTCCSNDTSNKIFNCMASPVEVGRGRMNCKLALWLFHTAYSCTTFHTSLARCRAQILYFQKHKSYISKSTNLIFQKAQIPHRKKHKSCITFPTNLNPPQG